MKLTLRGDGRAMAARLRAGGVECEYADRGHAVMMFSPDNGPEDYVRVERALDMPTPAPKEMDPCRAAPERPMSIREAVFAPSERVPARSAAGRVCAAPTVSCPPAIPIAVSGEVIDAGAVEAFLQSGIEYVRVVKERTSL